MPTHLRRKAKKFYPKSILFHGHAFRLATGLQRCWRSTVGHHSPSKNRWTRVVAGTSPTEESQDNAGSDLAVFFTEQRYVGVTLAVRAGTLLARRYNIDQLELLRHVCRLRDVEKLTFKAIAEQLAEQGFASARGAAPSAQVVFSIYKKWQMR